MKKEVLFRTCVIGGYNKKDVNEYIDSLENELIKLKSEKNADEDNTFSKGKDSLEESDFVFFDETFGENSKDKMKEDTLAVQKDKKEEVKIQAEKYEDEKKLEVQREYYEKQLKELNEKYQDLLRKTDMMQKEKAVYDEDYKAVKNVLLNARVDAEIIIAKAREKAKLIIQDAQNSLEDSRKKQYSISMKCLEENQNRLILSKGYFEEQIRNIENVQREMQNIKKDMEKQNFIIQEEGEEQSE